MAHAPHKFHCAFAKCMFAHSALIARVCMLQTRTPTSLANIQTISNTRKLATKSEQTSQRKTERKLKRRGRREEGGGYAKATANTCQHDHFMLFFSLICWTISALHALFSLPSNWTKRTKKNYKWICFTQKSSIHLTRMIWTKKLYRDPCSGCARIKTKYEISFFVS